MTKTRSTKNALISAILVLCMAFTGLLGTTFAWFTDSVTSSGNKIQAGTLKLDLELLDKESNTWKSLKNENDPIFDYADWEPGYTEVKLLKVENFGTLALKWKTVLTKHGEISALANVIDVYVRDYGVLTDAEAAALEYPQDRDLAGYTRVGTAAEFLSTMEETTKGELKAGQSAYLGLALKMRTDAGNEYQGMSLGGTFDITVYATQGSFEDDSFDNTYDEDATFPLAPGEISKVGSAVTADENNQVAAPVAYNNDFVKTEIPTGALLKDGATSVETVISYTERTADVQVTAGQVSRTIDLHVNGLSENNTVPVKHTLNEFFPKNYSRSNISIYHVDNGVTVPMTHVESLAELDAHNEMYYDPATGDVVLSMATHSEIVAVTNVGNPWDGTTVDYSWYNADATELYLDDVADFVGFARIVGGMDEKTADDFKGQTVYLNADINLGSETFYPVGYYNSTGSFEKVSGGTVTSDFHPFSGTFDGQGHTIANIYQNTWDMFGDYNSGYSGTPNHYRDGMGIFGWVHGGTVKNLAVHNFSSDGEFTTTGCVAAYSSGTSTFENIRVSNSNPRAYNVPNGGVVGYAYSEADVENHITFTNVTVDPTTKITALWGSWDVGCGGILGRVSDTSKVTMKDCTVGATIDVYNDVCGNYQYYQFRYSGMLIGTVGSNGDFTEEINNNLTFDNVSVYYGSWANDLHYYCELVENSLASYTHDHQMSRLTKINSIGELQDPITGNYNTTGNFVIVEDGKATCLHIRKNAEGYYLHNHSDYNGDGEEDYETINGESVLVEDKQCVYIPFKQLFSGYGWGASHAYENTSVKEAKYTITFMSADGNKVIDVQYITADGEITIDSIDDIAFGLLDEEYQVTDAFGGWATAGAVKKATIEDGNTTNYILYPTFAEKLTARWLDEDGNVVHTATFNKGESPDLTTDVPGPESATAGLEFSYWAVKEGNTYKNIKDFDFTKVESDIAIYPYYNIVQSGANGEAVLGLTPGADTDGDGVPDSYTVEAVEGLSGEVVIPGNINGVPVTVVTDIASEGLNQTITSVVIKDGVETIEANSMAMTSALKEVTIPASVKSIGSNAFADSTWGSLGSLVGMDKVVTITYDGTWEQWLAITDDGWDGGLEKGSTVVCNDGSIYEKTGNAWNSGDNYWQEKQ